ncbi:hypothetical protein CHS0354_035316 [Potamilus streckersoni]|uniref:Enoyl reductase (ER) domain-containing protein n=1 Tax=Potamilus streckersoni TaxID=2493646 RepID=A0AAE0VPH0_9BIVA|nr:hypothetical protein CHS0354_035316 [Potamilus streckersoni]
MQALAVNVGDLKKVMSNVKTRGILGEYQLENILEDLLTAEQYAKNVKTKEGSDDKVEFAVKMPASGDRDKPLRLPIDAKFPKEDYERLIIAYDEAVPDKIEICRKAFCRQYPQKCARHPGKALIVRKTETGLTSSVEKIPLAQIPVHDTLVKIEYSTLNYKDALAVSGKGKILREYPMIPGIDFAGTVEQTSSDKFKPGDRVILNGFGVGEKYWGGLSEYAYVNSDFLLKMPDGMDARKAMSIGTAGYTAALCVEELLSSGINNNSAPVVVTGATGGVGSFAIALLKQQNIVVSAVSGKAGASDYLKRLGASEIIPREQLMREAKPLETQRWGGAVDTLGGNALATILAECHSGATVTACGLAADFRLNTTVMPFILRESG